MTLYYKPILKPKKMIATLKHLRNAILILFVLSINSCSDFDDNEPVGAPAVITKDSELFDLLEKVTTDGDNPLEEIVCIDFIYPLAVNIYDANLNVIGTQILIGDDQFSAFLGNFPADHSLSISYPISTTLADGTVFTVNNNTELKLVIDSCSREDIISYCNGLFCSATGACVWKVQYTENEDNQYVGGTFLVNPDNTLIFNYNEVDYIGNWIFLYVNDELHININLEGSSAVAQYWNIDRPMQLGYNSITIQNPLKKIMLHKSCETSTDYAVGDVGPSNGTVFYDKGSYSSGWRYMEVAPTDLGPFEWGCSNSSIMDAQNSQIGRGLFNTAAIVNFHDNLLNYYTNPSVCNSLNDGTVAAKKAIMYSLAGNNDWFLPSEAELNLIYTNLHLAGLGNFANTTYWSSTETDATTANAIDFSTGIVIAVPKIPSGNTVKVRAIRYF